MKRRNEFIILFVIIIILASYLLLHKKDRTHYQLPMVPEIANNRITQIEIDTASGTVVLNRKDNTWYIGPEAYPAAPEKVNAMLDVVEKLTITALVSESKNYIRYDLNDDKKITVKTWDGTAIIRQFDIGKPAATYRHTFVKLDQDPYVYHARGDFRHKFDLTRDQLRDKTVLSFEPDHIEAVHITKDKKTYVIKRNRKPETKSDIKESGSKPSATQEPEPIWEAGDGRQLDASVVKRLVSMLSRLDCETYIDDKNKEDFTEPVVVVELTEQSKAHTLSVFSKTDKNATTYPAVSTENQYPFLLSESQVDDMQNMTEEILKEKNKNKPSS